MGKRAHHQRSERDASGWSSDAHCGPRLPLLLHDKVRLVVGTASHHGNATHATRWQKITFADDVASEFLADS